MTHFGGSGYKMESSEARALRSINQDSYDYRDQAKLLTKLTGDVSYMAQYMRNMQKGIDEANQNFIEQIGKFINEILVVIGGQGDTSFDFGDLKYIFQAIGSLFGFDQQTGIASIFPINLFSAGWHFFSTYILPINNFGDAIDNFIDMSIATILDKLGEVPIVGQAVQILAQWISDFRDNIREGGEFLNGLLSDWTAPFVQAIKNVVDVIQDIVDWFTNMNKAAISNFKTWAQRLPIMNNTHALGGLISGSNIPSLDGSKIGSGTLHTDRIPSLDTGKITSGTFGSAFLSDGAVSNVKLGTDISGDKIVTGTVTSGRVGALDASKITTGTFGSAYIADAAITGAKIGPLAVAASHIVDNAVTSGKIGPLAVLASHIVDNAVSNAKLGTDISGDKIVTGTVGSGRIGILDASKIGSGIFSGGLIPSLDSSKITTGNFAQSRVTNLTTDLGNAQTTATKAKGFVKSKVSAGSNILPNPGFENDAFVLSGTVNSSYSTDVARNGTRSLKLIGKNDYVGANLVVDDDSYYWIPASPGEWYYFEGYVYGKSTNNQNTGIAYLTIAWNLRSTSGVESVTYSDAIYTNATTARNGVWTKISGYVQAPATTFQMLPLAYLSNAVGNNETYYFDDILLREVTTSSEINKALFNQAFAGSAIISGAVPSLDASKITSGSFGSSLITDGAISNVKLGTDISGNKIATGTVGAAYISALDASKISTGSFDQTRVLNLPTDLAAKLASVDFSTKIKASANLVVNGSFESSTFSFTPYGTPTQYGFSLEQKHSGTRSYKWTQAASAFCGIWFQIGHAGGDRQLETRPGDKFYMEAWVFAHTNNTATGNSYFGAFCEDSTSSAYSYQTAASIPSWSSITKGQWTKFSGYVTVPAGFDRISFYFQTINDVPAGNIFYIDDLVVREVTEPQAINTALYNSTSPSSTVLTSVVPSLDASKITTGTLGTGLVPNLDASKITTGTLGTGLVPNLDASKITTGTLGTGLVPNLDAGKITSGSFAQNRITNLTTDLGTAQTTANIGVMKARHGSNMAYSPDFEDTSVPRFAWATLGVGNGSYSTEQKYTGSRSYKFTADAYAVSVGMGMQWYLDNQTQFASVSPGTTYYMECWIYAHASNATPNSGHYAYLTMYVRDSKNILGDGYLQAEYKLVSAVTKGQWTKFSGYVTVPAGYDQAVFYYFQQVTAVGDTYYMDNVIVREITHSASINNALYGSSVYAPQANVLSSVVPSLDASKVTTGNFAQSRITNLTTDISTVYSIGNGLSKQGSNVIADGGFESTAFSWASDVGITQSTEMPRTGLYSAKFVASGVSKAKWLTVNNNGASFIPGGKDTTFYCEFWIRGAATNSNTNSGSMGLQIIGINASGAWVEYPSIYIGCGPGYKNVWTKFTNYITLTNPDITQIGIWYVMESDVPNGDIYYLDDVVIREISHSALINSSLYGPSVYAPQSNVLSSVVPSLDASKVTTGNFAQSRITNLSSDLTSISGTANTAKSVARTISYAGSNLLKNPGFEDTNFVLWPWWGDTALLNDNATYARSGSRSVKLIGRGTTNQFSGLNVSTDTNGVVFIPATAGDTFYMEFWVKASAAYTNLQYLTFRLVGVNASGGETGEYPAVSIRQDQISSTSWTKVSGYVRLSAATTASFYAQLYVDDLTPTTSSFYVDDLIIREIAHSAAINFSLYGTSVYAPQSNILSSVVPSLDASKVTTGNFAQSRITNLTTDITNVQNTSNKVTSVANTISKRGSNILQNPSFEDSNYIWWADSQWTRSSDTARTGSWSAKALSDGNSGILVVTVDGASYNAPLASQGDVYYMEFWIKAANGNTSTTGNVYLQLVPRDGGTYNTGEYPYVGLYGTLSNASKTSWTRVSGYVSLTLSTTAQFYAQLVITSVPSGNAYYVDDVAIREVSHSATVSSALYGSSVYVPQSNVLSSVVPSLDASKVTTGNFAQNRITNLTNDISTNYAIGNGAAKRGSNVISDGGFENTSFNWASDAGITRSTEMPRTGTYSAKLVASGVGKAKWLTVDNNGAAFMPGAKDTTFYVEYWVRGASTNSNTSGGYVYVQIIGIDAAQNWVQYPSVAFIAGPSYKNVWTKISGYASLTNPDITQIGIWLTMEPYVANGDIYYIDDVVVREISHSASINSALYGTSVYAPQSNVLGSVVPSLDASKVTTGNFAQNRITNLTTDLSKSSGIATSLSRKSSNICTDPGFENTSMAFPSNGPVRTSEMSMANGAYSAKFTANGTWQSISLTVDGNGQLYPAGSVNDSYYCEFYLRGHINNGSTNTGALYCQIVGYDVNGNQTEAPVSIWAASLSTYKNTWYKVSGYLTLTNASTINILPIIGMSNDVPSGYIFYVDNVIIREISHSAQINSALTGSTSPVSTVLSGAVPSLDASKVTSGNFAQNRITNLPTDLAAKLTGTNFNAYVQGGNNLATNPGLEDANLFIGWQSVGNQLAFNYNSTYVRTGSASLKMTGPGDLYHEIVSNPAGTLYLKGNPGQTYYLECWVKGDANNPTTPTSYNTLVIGVWAYSSIDGYIDASVIYAAGTTIGKSGWVKVSGNVTISSDSRINLVRPLILLNGNATSAYTYYIDDIVVREVSEINSVNAQIANALTNTTDSITSGGFTQALSGLTKTYSTLADATRAVQTLQTSKVSNTSKGALVTVNFDDYQDGALSTRCPFFAVSYTGAGNGTIDIAAGTAGWTTNNNGDRDCKIIYGGTGSTGGSATYTDYQYIKGTMTQPPQQNGGYFYALGRVNAAGTEYVFAKAYCDGFLSYKADFGYKLATGSEVVLKSGISLTWSLDMAFEVGTTAGVRTYKIWSGNKVVWDSTGTNGVSDTASNYGANNRYWGSIAQTRSGKTSGRLGGVSVADNQTPTYSGSTARMYRASGTSVTLYGSGYGDAVLPSFFDNTSWNSLDITVEPSNNVFTVTTAGTYAISARLYVNSQVLAWCQVNLQRYTNGAWQSTPIQRGDTITPQNISTTLDAALTGSWVQYLAAGDKVRLMTKKSTAGDVSVLSGESTGSQSYFSISLLSS